MGLRRAEAAIVSLGGSLTVVALFCFWPLHLSSLHASARSWRFPYHALERQQVKKALVFADRMVKSALGATWAYYPPNPSPSLDDDVLFVRIPRTTGHALAAMREFHARRYPDRPAIYLRLDGAKSALIPLGALTELAPPVDGANDGVPVF